MYKKKTYVKFGFLAFIGLLIIIVFIADWKLSKNDIEEEESESIDEEVISDDLNQDTSQVELDDINDKYSLEEVDLYSEEYEEYDDLGVFDYEKYYKDTFESEVYKEITSVTSTLIKSLLEEKQNVKLSEKIEVMIDEKINQESFIRDKKVKDVVVYPTSPTYKNEISIGVNVSYENEQSEVFIVSILKRENVYVIKDIVSDWSD